MSRRIERKVRLQKKTQGNSTGVPRGQIQTFSKKSAKKNSGVTWVSHKELSPDATEFPVHGIRGLFAGLASTESRTMTLRLGYDAAVTSDGSGIIATVIPNSPSSGSNWSNYAAVFDEYRILAMTVEFDPLWSTGGSSASYWAPIASVVDRSDSTALTGYTLAERYTSHKKTPGQRRFVRKWNMASVDEATFRQTSAAAANGWVKFYSTGNTVSLTVGRLNVSYYVQFRGLGIN